MSFVIAASGSGPVDDDLREAFGELVRTLRAASPVSPDSTLAASLTTSSATYMADDVPDDTAGDDDTDEEDPE